MHPSSLNNMKIVKSKYLKLTKQSRILDVGGRGLNKDRSYRSIFEHESQEYLIADVVNGPGVTHVMPGPYTLPFDDDYFDLVVSGQMLEHCSNPFKSVSEMKRVTRSSGYIVIIAPSTGPRHDSQDCWRFMDDAFKAIVNDIGGIKIIADWIDKTAQDERSARWKDHVFVGQKK